MATELDRLLVRLEADTERLRREMARAIREAGDEGHGPVTYQ